MNFNQATKKATAELLRTKAARTYTVDGQPYTVDLQRDEDGNLEVTTWGFDYEVIRVPQTWTGMIRQKMWAQLEPGRLNNIVLRYCFRIMRLCEGSG